MGDKFKVYWTKESKIQVDLILNYLNKNWGERESDNFLDLLLHFEMVISKFPKSFKSSSYFRGCRLGLVHRYVSVIYRISGNSIFVLTVIDNRMNLKKIDYLLFF
jgi:plasmid stabilization system protein ParE